MIEERMKIPRFIKRLRCPSKHAQVYYFIRNVMEEGIKLNYRLRLVRYRVVSEAFCVECGKLIETVPIDDWSDWEEKEI